MRATFKPGLRQKDSMANALLTGGVGRLKHRHDPPAARPQFTPRRRWPQKTQGREKNQRTLLLGHAGDRAGRVADRRRGEAGQAGLPQEAGGDGRHLSVAFSLSCGAVKIEGVGWLGVARLLAPSSLHMLYIFLSSPNARPRAGSRRHNPRRRQHHSRPQGCPTCRRCILLDFVERPGALTAIGLCVD
jgi:hypothetical protein